MPVNSAMSSKLDQFKKSAKMLRSRLDGILPGTKICLSKRSCRGHEQIPRLSDMPATEVIRVERAGSYTTLKIRIGFAAGLAFALGAVALSYWATNKRLDTNRWVERADSTITSLHGTLEALNNLERSSLSWVMAGMAMHNLRARRFRDFACQSCHSSAMRPVEAERFRDTHLAMIADLTRHVQGLRTLISSQPAQQERFRLLESLVQSKAALAREEIPSEVIQDFGTAQAVLLGRDAHLTSEIQEIVAGMQQAESKLLARQLSERAANERSEILAVGLLCFLTICTAVAASVVIYRDLARRKALVAIILSSLQHKEALLQELHHRVKNNLQLICSLLSLQTPATADPDTRNLLRQAEARVRSMALVHETLYRSEDLVKIDFGDYLRALSDRLLQSYSCPSHNIRLALNGFAMHLDVDRAILCGMIVNELLTNTLRHAFPDSGRGEVVISLEPSGMQIVLSVRDNGVGMPRRVHPGSPGTLGLRLVRMLTTQLKGTFEMRSENGTEVTITFPQAA